MDTAHNKVEVYIRVRPYAYDCEVDIDNGKAVKDGVKCIIQLRKVDTTEVGQKDSGPRMAGILPGYCRGATPAEYADRLGHGSRFLLSEPPLLGGRCDRGPHLNPAGDDE